MRECYVLCVAVSILLMCMSFTNAFDSIKTQVPTRNPRHSIITEPKFSVRVMVTNKFSFTKLYATNEEEVSFSDSDATALGVTGLVASVIMLYSESVLFRTGCGLPAGPLGLYGAAEGVSYLGVVVLVGYSLFTKFRTGSGLPAGPIGVLGAAEGVAYLAILAGIVVLFAQINNYGFIPNALPMEGAMCS